MPFFFDASDPEKVNTEPKVRITPVAFWMLAQVLAVSDMDVTEHVLVTSELLAIDAGTNLVTAEEMVTAIESVTAILESERV